MDVFSDADTQHAAETSFRVKYHDGGFDKSDFKQIIHQIINLIGSHQAVDFLFGSGFEAAPVLLEYAGKHFHVLGNKPEVIRQLKTPRQFFPLLKNMQIPFPEISLLALENSRRWLHKTGGGSGGTHIRQVLQETQPGHDGYFQREVRGVPVSLLFAANGKQIQPIGFNLQWLSPTADLPYRFGGVVGNWPIPACIQQQIIDAAQKITSALGLRGLNSLDAIMEGEQLMVLEVNPRLSASFGLYQSQSGNLLDLHLRGCNGELLGWQQTSGAKAQLIVYAPFDLYLSSAIIWPDWAADLPVVNTFVSADQPLCTVCAEAENAESALALALNRIEILKIMIEKYKEEQI